MYDTSIWVIAGGPPSALSAATRGKEENERADYIEFKKKDGLPHTLLI
jgi:hypothetical protein